jgi:hypothetical protein
MFSCGNNKEHNTFTYTDTTVSALPSMIDSTIEERLPDQDLAAYKYFLDSLNQNNSKSVQYGITYYQKHFSEATSIKRDSAFLLYESFFLTLTRGYCARLSAKIQCPGLNENTGRLIETKEFIKLKKILAPDGIYLVALGSCFISIEAPGFLEQQFSSYGSSALKEYLAVTTIIEKRRVEDVSYLKNMESLSSIVSALSSFERKYPLSIPILKEKVKYECKTYLLEFLNGSDWNTIFYSNSDGLDSLPMEGRNIYRDFIKINSGSEAGKIVKEYYNFLAKYNFEVASAARQERMEQLLK